MFVKVISLGGFRQFCSLLAPPDSFTGHKILNIVTHKTIVGLLLNPDKIVSLQIQG